MTDPETPADAIEVVRAGEPFAMTPAWLIESAISDRAVRLWAILWTYADRRSYEAWPGRRTLARQLGCSVDSIDRATRELMTVGALRVERRRRTNGSQTSNLYTLVEARPGRTVAAPPSAPVRPPQPQGCGPIEQEPREPEPTNARGYRIVSPAATTLAGQLCAAIERSTGKPHKVTSANLVELDRLLRIDGADPAEVAATIQWATTDDFWRANVLSAKALRRHYPRLRLQMARGSRATPSRSAEFLEAFEDEA